MTKHDLTISADDYLKAIYTRSLDVDFATTKAVAEELRVSSPSVTGMFKKLASSRLINYSRYNGATLTPEGRMRVMRLIRRHRLVELFLHRCLKMRWNEIHQEAEVLEHVLSDSLEARIDRWLGSPKFDPHGSPIPDSRGRIARRVLSPLGECPPKSTVIVGEVLNQDSELLSFLERQGIVPGRKLSVLSQEKFGGHIRVRVAGKTRIVGLDAARQVMVEMITAEPK